MQLLSHQLSGSLWDCSSSGENWLKSSLKFVIKFETIILVMKTAFKIYSNYLCYI